MFTLPPKSQRPCGSTSKLDGEKLRQKDAKEYANEYDQGTLAAFWQEFDRVFLEEWSQLLPPGSAILDVGCGTGRSSLPFAEMHKVTGVEISPWMLARARERLRQSVQLIEGDAENLPFEANSFDFVISYGTFHHLPDPFLGLKEALRVLKPGGKLLCVENNLTPIISADAFIGRIRHFAKELVLLLFPGLARKATVDNHPGHPGLRYGWEYEDALKSMPVKYSLRSVEFPLIPARIYWNSHVLSRIKIGLDQVLDKIGCFRGKGSAMILVVEKTTGGVRSREELQ